MTAARWALAILLVCAGVIAGWLLVTAVLALPLSEGVLFGLSGLAAAIFLGGAIVWRRNLWMKATLIGAFVGTAGSVVLVLLVVV